MMKIIKIIILGVVLCASFALSAAEQSAGEVFRLGSARLKKAAAIEASFTVSHAEQKTTGKITVAGNKFILKTPGLSTWFDGKTQWAYSPQIAEVNVSEPTPGELAQINPLAILGTLQTGFNYRRLSSVSGFDRIELIPKEKGEYAKIVITFDASTHFPSEIVFTAADRSVTAIKITSIRECKKPAESAFRFDKKLYPGVEIVDLR